MRKLVKEYGHGTRLFILRENQYLVEYLPNGTQDTYTAIEIFTDTFHYNPNSNGWSHRYDIGDALQNADAFARDKARRR